MLHAGKQIQRHRTIIQIRMATAMAPLALKALSILRPHLMDNSCNYISFAGYMFTKMILTGRKI